MKLSRQFPVLLLTGPRQTGKTTLLQQLSEKDLIHKRTYVSLDDANIRQLALTDPALFFQRFEAPLLIDEIQYAQANDKGTKALFPFGQ
jgi:predicted AAA+ superfamily ATPase